MSWLDRLKNHRAPDDLATEPTKQGSVGFVALEPGDSGTSSPSIVVPRLRNAQPANADSLACQIERTCASCTHLLRHGTCCEPVDAGLSPSFETVWPPAGHAAGCSAYSSKAPAERRDRPHRLTAVQADRCHTPSWSDAEIRTFQMRHARFMRLDMSDQEADDLAERLTLRDRDNDDRRICLECRELGQSGRCSAAARGEMTGVDRQMHPPTSLLMRCQSFRPSAHVLQLQKGSDDASQYD